MLNEPKVAQMAAFFLRKGSGSMPVLKLMKLLYLADRRSLEQYSASMSGDQMVSMPHGPVLSQTYEFLSGSRRSGLNGWEHWMLPRAGYIVELTSGRDVEPLTELSQADTDILNAVWREFGQMDQWQIRDYTHDNCPEWKDPKGSSRPIPYERVFKAFGKEALEAKQLGESLDVEDHVDQTFARL